MAVPLSSPMEHYIIKKKLYSSVTRDRDVLLVERDGEAYAMKRLDLDEDPKKQEAVFNEVKMLQSLVHPNIIKYFEAFQHEQRLCIVMEYAQSGDLKERVKEKREEGTFFSEEQIWEWFSQLCLAVKFLHDSKILHRDLKILNVFISRNGLVKLGDFGVSKQLENTEVLTSTHVGTAYYLPPEICNNNPYNHKVDIWMLGCLLYELCSLSKPFDGDNLFAVIKQIINKDPIPIPDYYSNTMSQLVTVMMQKDPDMRPDINQIVSISEIQSQFKKLKETNVDIYQNYSFPNPKKYTGFLKQNKPTLSNKAFIPNDKKSQDSTSNQASQQIISPQQPPLSQPSTSPQQPASSRSALTSSQKQQISSTSKKASLEQFSIHNLLKQEALIKQQQSPISTGISKTPSLISQLQPQQPEKGVILSARQEETFGIINNQKQLDDIISQIQPNQQLNKGNLPSNQGCQNSIAALPSSQILQGSQSVIPGAGSGLSQSQQLKQVQIKKTSFHQQHLPSSGSMGLGSLCQSRDASPIHSAYNSIPSQQFSHQLQLISMNPSIHPQQQQQQQQQSLISPQQQQIQVQQQILQSHQQSQQILNNRKPQVRYKPPIVIDTSIAGNFSQKKSTPNSDVIQKDKNQHSVTNAQHNQPSSKSVSSNATSNTSSTKNNSTKSNQHQNQSQYSQQHQQLMNQQNLPTTKVRPKYFNFPQSPNRTILVSDYLKQKLGEDKFFKVRQMLETSSNPLKLLEEHPQGVLQIIGEENLELAKMFRYIITTQTTPSSQSSSSSTSVANHHRHKSFQGFEHQVQPDLQKQAQQQKKPAGFSATPAHLIHSQISPSQQQQVQFKQSDTELDLPQQILSPKCNPYSNYYQQQQLFHSNNEYKSNNSANQQQFGEFNNQLKLQSCQFSASMYAQQNIQQPQQQQQQHQFYGLSPILVLQKSPILQDQKDVSHQNFAVIKKERSQTTHLISEFQLQQHQEEISQDPLPKLNP